VAYVAFSLFALIASFFLTFPYEALRERVRNEADTAGYFVGKSFGRHKLTAHISPGKTIEGAVGIVAGSLLIGVLCKLIFLPELTLNQALVLSGIMGVIGQLGDLCESMMKRAFGTKESGWIFPGHGGVLDRLDSILFAAPITYYYVLFFFRG
jgi:phosphatidate cytidylyltransferase